jgi:hypothetical protein
MSVTVFLDGEDITADLEEQYPLPSNLYAGIFPDNSHNHWYNLWRCVQRNSTLRQSYQNKAIHELKVVDSAGGTYNAKIILRTKYTARNR